ncbi:hypothetical protein Vadar_026442 [Vaccinium darrowii]|uniref:Uncharacterized protein n=1 Tax=Vaccinium darrowii TaxID=229202 RepID=A0ACB7ZMP8_9ERIC|nr:hypothetical protein Vadar_026442 [Vaccinium darrowii]
MKVLQPGYHLKGLIQFLFNFKWKTSYLKNGFCSKSCVNGEFTTRVSSGFRGKSSDLGNQFCSKNCLGGKCSTRVSPCGLLEFFKISEPIGQLEEKSEIESGNVDNVKENFYSSGEFDEIAKGNGIVKGNFDSNGKFGDYTKEQEFVDEDEENDLMALRKLVKSERQRAKNVGLELEKERIAAATAAEEAMAMILRLQNEKSLIKMEAKQYRRLAEEKQIHDQEVIQSLRWIVMKHESERSLLEDQLRFFRRKLTVCVKGDEGDESEGFDESLNHVNSNMEDSPGDALISSLDIDMSPRTLFFCLAQILWRWWQWSTASIDGDGGGCRRRWWWWGVNVQ